MDAAGDIIYASAADTPARLALGTAGKVLKVNSGATAPEWAVDPTTDVVTTAGDLIYGTGADAVARLGIGTASQVLAVNSGATAPEWITPSAGGMTLISTTSLSGTSVTLSSIPSTYKDLYIELYDARWNTGAQDLRITTNSFGTDGAQSGTDNSAVSSTTIQSYWYLVNNSAHQANGFYSAIYIHGYNNTRNIASIKTLYYISTSYRMAQFAAGKFGGEITSITLSGSNSYAFNNGTIKLYGVK